MGSSSQQAPKAPDPSKVYVQGIATNLKYAPQLAAAESSLRGVFDNTSIEQTLARQKQFAPAFANQWGKALTKAVGPWAEAARTSIGDAVSADLSKGYSLDGWQVRNAQQGVRAGQVASGNFLGNAAVGAEGIAVGNASQKAEQQRIAEAQQTLGLDNAIKQFAGVGVIEQAATTPDAGYNYENSSLWNPQQNSLAGYQQQATQFAQNANPNDYLSPWQRAAQGAYIGLRQGWEGGSLYGGFVTGAYGAIGGALGGSFQGLINAPDYRWNVQNSGFSIYGNPSAYNGAVQFGGGVAASGIGTWLSAASAAG